MKYVTTVVVEDKKFVSPNEITTICSLYDQKLMLMVRNLNINFQFDNGYWRIMKHGFDKNDKNVIEYHINLVMNTLSHGDKMPS